MHLFRQNAWPQIRESFGWFFREDYERVYIATPPWVLRCLELGIRGEHERQELAGARDAIERARPQLALHDGAALGVGLALVDAAVVALGREQGLVRGRGRGGFALGLGLGWG